jgi:Holliday junction resolvase RusA-like endonuclease
MTAALEHSVAVERASFLLPFTAKPWQRVAPGKDGRSRVPEATRQWKTAVADTAAISIGRAWRLDGMYRLSIMIGLPNWATRDWDNMGKSIGDALNGLCWHDDNQVVDGGVRKWVHAPGDPYGGGMRWAGHLHTLYTHVDITRIGDWPVKARRRP